MTDNRKKRKAGSILRTVVLAAALVAFCFSVYKLAEIYMGYRQGSQEYSGLEQYATGEVQEPQGDSGGAGSGGQSGSGGDGSGQGAGDQTGSEGSRDTAGETGDFTYETETETDAVTGQVTVKKRKLYYMKNPVDFQSLGQINDDIVGWLRVGALDLNYPVTQTTDNDYYLHRTFERAENAAGCIFLDYQNDPDFQDDNTIVYGHNMKDGSMFGRLRHFLDEGVYESDPYFWIYTSDRIYKYEIFNCTTVGAVSSTYTLTFGTRKDFQNYLDVAAAQSQVDSEGVKVTADDKIVTLSTCTGDEETRFIVQGKLVNTYASR